MTLVPKDTSRKFRLGLKKFGIRHQRTDPGCPWQNGRIERLFGTLFSGICGAVLWGILGVSVYLRDSGEFKFHSGPAFAQVIWADETNRATPKTQNALSAHQVVRALGCGV